MATDKNRVKEAQDYLFSGGKYRPEQKLSADVVKSPVPNDNPDAVEEKTDTPPTPLAPGYQKVKDLGDRASETGKRVLAEAEKNKAEKDAQAKAEADAIAKAEREAGTTRYKSRMRADADKNGNFRSFEERMIKSNNQDYSKYSSDADPEEYYAHKYGKKVGDYQRLAKTDGRMAGGFEDLHELSSSEEGRNLMREALRRAEADSARAAQTNAKNDRIKAAQKYLTNDLERAKMEK